MLKGKWSTTGELQEVEHQLEETDSLRKYVRKQLGYGTATRPLDGNELFVLHYVSTLDTLQGIALKYGVTVRSLLFSSSYRLTILENRWNS